MTKISLITKFYGSEQRFSQKVDLSHNFVWGYNGQAIQKYDES